MIKFKKIRSEELKDEKNKVSDQTIITISYYDWWQGCRPYH